MRNNKWWEYTKYMKSTSAVVFQIPEAVKEELNKDSKTRIIGVGLISGRKKDDLVLTWLVDIGRGDLSWSRMSTDSERVRQGSVNDMFSIPYVTPLAAMFLTEGVKYPTFIRENSDIMNVYDEYVFDMCTSKVCGIAKVVDVMKDNAYDVEEKQS